MSDYLQPIEDLDNARIERLYRTLTKLFPHPFDWMYLLEKPPFWRWRMRAARTKVQLAFAAEGFQLNRRVALRYYTADSQSLYEDAGGAICRKLKYALDGQFIMPNHNNQ